MDNLKIIINAAKVLKYSQMVINIRENTKIINSMDKVFINGKIMPFIKDNLIMEIDKVMVSGLLILLRIAIQIQLSRITIQIQIMTLKFKQIHIKDNIKMIKRMDLEFINGKMELSIKVNSKMISNMDKVSSFIKVVKKYHINGKMDKS